MDLFYAPFNVVHEFFYITFMTQELKEKDRKEQEQKQKEEEEAAKRVENMNRPKPALLSNRLSPAAQARESQYIKSQSDEESRRNNRQSNKSELSPSTGNVDMEDLVEALEEGV